MRYFFEIAILASVILFARSQITTCHYTCRTCFGLQYYQCLSCPQNRGTLDASQPISGMCYCNNETDQSTEGVCTDTSSFNYNNKAAIAALIALCLFFSICTTLINGMRYFLIKTIEDVQEISIIVFINLYFPQQFDIFLTHLYRFNISSYTFESLTKGNLFFVNDSEELISSTDGQNIFGKYKLLYKTANFFANQFTWIIVFVCLIAFGILIKVLTRFLKNRQQNLQQNRRKVLQSGIKTHTQQNMNNTQYTNPMQQIRDNGSGVIDQRINYNRSQLTNKKAQEQVKYSAPYYYINKLNNIIWLNLFIIFFYLSLTQINLNVFTQVANLTFSSSFAAAGAYFSALFMAVEFVLLVLLALKCRQEAIKPDWLRDSTYTAPIYLIKTNQKIISRYFWFFAATKKILSALLITVYYKQPINAIIAVSVVQGIFLAFAIYAEPHQRRYIRIHYYFMQAFKLYLYLSLINFTQKYIQYARMIELTKIMYNQLTFIFSFNLIFILLNIIAERSIYMRALSKKFCKDDPENKYLKGRIAYYSEGRLFVFEKE